MNKKQLIIVISILSLIGCFSVFAQKPLLSEKEIISWHYKALELKNNGKYEEAEKLFKLILAAEPTNANAKFDLGNVYLFQKRYNDALNCYREAERQGLDTIFMSDYYLNLSL